jgi:hypothetical protein
LYTVHVPASWISPSRFPAKLFPGPATVRLHKGLPIFRPYVCVLVVWLSVAVLPATALSSQLRPADHGVYFDSITTLVDVRAVGDLVVEDLIPVAVVYIHPVPAGIVDGVGANGLSVDFLFGWSKELPD